jgi:hypothetical protein
LSSASRYRGAANRVFNAEYPYFKITVKYYYSHPVIFANCLE